MRATCRPLALALLTLAPAPLLAQDVVENDTAKIFAGHWMQSKEADKNGLLMYLDQERAMQGDYFSIRCEDGARSVRLGFGRMLPAAGGAEAGRAGYPARAGFTIDDASGSYGLEYTGATADPAISGGDIHGYRMVFSDEAMLDDFLQALRRGAMLRIEGQELPVDLTGSAQAIEEQAAYCR